MKDYHQVIAIHENENIKGKILDLYNSGTSYHEMCIDSGVSETTIRNFAKGKPVTRKVLVDLARWFKRVNQ